jgi:hypothetical protein
MKISTATRLEKLEADKPSDHGQWVRGLSGKMIWDPWNPVLTEDETRAARESMIRQMDQIAARLRADPNWKEPTAAERAQLRKDLEARLPDMPALWAAPEA